MSALSKLRVVLASVVLMCAAPLQAATVVLDKPLPLDAKVISELDTVKGKDPQAWRLVAFGYTHCSDVCPTTLSNFSQLIRLAGKERFSLDGTFVTLDPDRDTDDVLSGYTKNFGDRISYLRLDEPKLAHFMGVFGVEAEYYNKRPNNPFYLIDHSTTAFLIDPKGNVRVLFDALTDMEEISQLIRDSHKVF